MNALQQFISAAEGPITSEELKGYSNILEAFEALLSVKSLSKTKAHQEYGISGVEVKHISKGKAKMTSAMAHKLTRALGGNWESWVALGSKRN